MHDVPPPPSTTPALPANVRRRSARETRPSIEAGERRGILQTLRERRLLQNLREEVVLQPWDNRREP